MKFSQFNLDRKLVNYLSNLGYNNLSKIQEISLSTVLSNTSCLIKAPTGSGKTLCYLIPILNDLDLNKLTQCVIIVPTSLLAEQLNNILKDFKGYKEFKVDVLIDGSSLKSSFDSQIIIATPSQFLFNYSKLNLKDLTRLVIDEGDMIIFDGFENQLAEILSLQLKGSKFFFTASVDEHLNTFVRKYISASKIISLDEKSITSNNVTHYFVDIKNRNKIEALILFIKLLNPYKCLVFVSKKDELKVVDDALNRAKIEHLSLYGELPKREQARILKEFSNSKYHILLGTDLIARGFDVNDISDVISIDLPYDLTYYFHRAGRTARFDKKGNSYVFYNDDNISKARELNSKGLNFHFLTLKEDQIKKERELSDKAYRPKINNMLLEAEIKKNISKVRSNKVKPGYKKKIKRVIERTKAKHKQDIIKKNLEKRNQMEGTNFTYFNESSYSKSKKKQSKKN